MNLTQTVMPGGGHDGGSAVAAPRCRLIEAPPRRACIVRHKVVPLDPPQRGRHAHLIAADILDRRIAEIDVLGRCPFRGTGVAVHHRRADGKVLVQPDAAAHQVARHAHDVRQQHVMRRLIDQPVQLDIAVRLLGRVIGAVHGLHPAETGADRGAVRLRHTPRGEARSVRLDGTAEFEIIGGRALVIGQLLGQRVDQPVQKPRHDGAGLARRQQTLLPQQRQRLAQRRAGDPKLLGQVPLGCQPFPGSRDAFETHCLWRSAMMSDRGAGRMTLSRHGPPKGHFRGQGQAGHPRLPRWHHQSHRWPAFAGHDG